MFFSRCFKVQILLSVVIWMKKKLYIDNTCLKSIQRSRHWQWSNESERWYFVNVLLCCTSFLSYVMFIKHVISFSRLVRGCSFKMWVYRGDGGSGFWAILHTWKGEQSNEQNCDLQPFLPKLYLLFRHHWQKPPYHFQILRVFSDIAKVKTNIYFKHLKLKFNVLSEYTNAFAVSKSDIVNIPDTAANFFCLVIFMNFYWLELLKQAKNFQQCEEFTQKNH